MVWVIVLNVFENMTLYTIIDGLIAIGHCVQFVLDEFFKYYFLKKYQ